MLFVALAILYTVFKISETVERKERIRRNLIDWNRACDPNDPFTLADYSRRMWERGRD